MSETTGKKKTIQKRAPRTLKERRFVKALATAPSATQAVIDAGYEVSNRHVAEQIAYENMRKLEMGHWFHEAGLTHEVIAQNTAVIALTATKRDQFSGEMYEDNTARLKAMEFAAKLMGLLSGKDEGGDTNIHVNVVNYGSSGNNPSV
jgi:hypothetical protein